jgi:hypothetical protein
MRAHFDTASALLAILVLAVLAAAQNGDSVKIYDDSDKYEFYGCYNETTEIKGSAQTRALGDGINQAKEGEMTVPMCLSFCSNGRTEYRYAGLEYARECWCGQVLAGISEKLDDGECDLPCDGDNSTACGGRLKLSVYRLSTSAAGVIGVSSAWAAATVVVAFLLHIL